ncbi:hypothetical protein M2C68_21300, partial [Pseudomonas sp. BAgro211]|nr:hypothetical protein [Pseudomonas sp. BAgro211]
MYESTEIQKTLLTEAAAILWRLDDSVLPRTADELLEFLPLDVEQWLPEAVRLCYCGPLAA